MTGKDEYTGATVPDVVVGELRGYREWRVGADGMLWSLWHGSEWRGTVLVAECLKVIALADAVHNVPHSPHAAPDYDCTCGIYAYWYPGVSGLTLDSGLRTAHVVSGVVDSSGLCVVGTRGVRARTVTIRALAPRRCAHQAGCADWWHRAAPRLAVRYPGVRLFEDPMDMWDALPPIPPTGLLDTIGEEQHA